MTLSSQDKKENTFAPAAAGPSGVQTQRHDAGVTARRPAQPCPHRAPPSCPGSETPNRAEDSGGMHRSPWRAECHSQWPSRTVSPRLQPN